jgi:hypothetical protein
VRVGGSRAQRDLIEHTLLAAYLKAGSRGGARSHRPARGPARHRRGHRLHGREAEDNLERTLGTYENDREPDHPHAPRGRRAGGSLAERHDVHQHGLHSDRAVNRPVSPIWPVGLVSLSRRVRDPGATA